MVLVDTSIWIDHFRSPKEAHKVLLLKNQVAIHPLVIGERGCDNLRNRQLTIGLLDSLPKAVVATDPEAYHLIENQQLYGLGIGILDVHLICACRLTGCQLWTKDEALVGIADKLGLLHR